MDIDTSKYKKLTRSQLEKALARADQCIVDFERVTGYMQIDEKEQALCAAAVHTWLREFETWFAVFGPHMPKTKRKMAQKTIDGCYALLIKLEKL